MKRPVANLCMNCKHFLKVTPKYLSSKHGLCDLSYSCNELSGHTTFENAAKFRASNCKGFYFEPEEELCSIIKMFGNEREKKF